MKEKLDNNSGPIIQVIIAIISVVIGYPYGGSIFILLMTPLVVYLVLKKDAAYMPALMIHCTSDTSIMYAVLFSMIMICFIEIKGLFRNTNTRWLFILLLLGLPIYIWLTWQRYRLDGDTWQVSLTYTSFYLSFWVFLYYYLVSDTYSVRIAKNIMISLIVFAIVCVLLMQFSVRLLYMIIIVGIIYGLFLLFRTQHKFWGIVLGIGSLLFFMSLSGLTFTLLFTFVYAVFIAYMANKGKNRITRTASGIIPYLILLLLMVWGISNYSTATYGEYSDNVSFSDINLLFNRIQYKLFGDRAPFWDAGWKQLLYYTPILPMHDIPNFTAYSADGHVFEDVSFGAHNTPIQLLRIFGILMGGVLILCYIINTVSASKVFTKKRLDFYSLSLFSVSFCYSMVLFLTGTASMLPDMALFSFGFLGIAHGLSKKSEQI
jgi:hypothetical protein